MECKISVFVYTLLRDQKVKISQNLKVKAQNYNSKVKTELFFEMNKFLVLSCSFYFLLLSFKFL
jgi:hypothetical protein